MELSFFFGAASLKNVGVTRLACGSTPTPVVGGKRLMVWPWMEPFTRHIGCSHQTLRLRPTFDQALRRNRQRAPQMTQLRRNMAGIPRERRKNIAKYLPPEGSALSTELRVPEELRIPSHLKSRTTGAQKVARRRSSVKEMGK